MFQKISYILLLAFLALSCTGIVKEAGHTYSIDFETEASTDSWVETKSVPVTELTEPFGIFAYCYKGDWSPASAIIFWGPYVRPYASYIPKNFYSEIWTKENPNAYFPRPRGYVAMNSATSELGRSDSLFG